MAFRFASGFPLYLFPLHFSPLKNLFQISHSPFPNPNSRHCSKRMPLQSLTHWKLKTESGKWKVNFQFSTFRFQLKNAVGTTEKTLKILSHLRRYDFLHKHYLAEVPCFALHHLPIICRPSRTCRLVVL